MPPESLRAEAARRGITVYAVRAERARARGYTGYRQERHVRPEELRRRREVERKREEERPYLPAPGDFPLTSEETPHGLQGPFGPTPDPDWDYYWPTRTINPPRPRTLQARYSRRFERLEVIFRDGTPWHYDEVTPGIWNRFKRTESPGRYINSVLNGYPYARGGWGSIVGEGEGGTGIPAGQEGS
jgi:hypothetical protein